MNNLDIKPNIIAITEVKSKNKKCQTTLSEFNLLGYNVISNDLDFESNSRGIVIYIDTKIEYSIIECKTKFKESLVIKIRVSAKEELYLCVVYRSPNSTAENNKLLLQIVTEMSGNNNNVIFIGDFNLPGIDWNNWNSTTNNQLEIDFISKLRDFYLLQHVNSPTRVRGADTPHILDLVITNDSFIEEINYYAPLGSSDHSVIYTKSSFQCNYKELDHKLNYNKGDYVGLKQSLDVDWDSLFMPCNNDVESMWKVFKDIIITNSQKFIPYVKNFKCPLGKKWPQPLPENVRKLIKKKSKAWKNVSQLEVLLT